MKLDTAAKTIALTLKELIKSLRALECGALHKEVASDIATGLTGAYDVDDVVVGRVGDRSGEIAISLVCMEEHGLKECIQKGGMRRSAAKRVPEC